MDHHPRLPGGPRDAPDSGRAMAASWPGRGEALAAALSAGRASVDVLPCRPAGGITLYKAVGSGVTTA